MKKIIKDKKITNTIKKHIKKVVKKDVNKVAKKLPVIASAESCFWLNSGQILKDLNDLSTALESISDEVFTHHVNEEKNDFADWVENILEDSVCADSLRKCKTKNAASKVVTLRIKKYA